MILVDKDIRERLENEELISNYNEKNIGCISYDLEIEEIIKDKQRMSSYDLAPGETVWIKTKETLQIPADLTGRIAEKNSRMRMGLVVTGPQYQPGHVTKAFLRVQNISESIITIKKDDEIAQIIFEKLSQRPGTTYNKSFQGEDEYRGFGAYETEYRKQIKNIEDVQEKFENKERQIYSNILTLMGIFVAIFSLISMNFQALSQVAVDAKFILTMNVSLCFCITFMLGLVLFLLNKKANKYVTGIFIGVLILLGISTVLLSIF